ncbi:MAG: hypothetical protein J0I12_21185 [Candidatus Eremiobacteraeota bacterium]|nr:hypothetical protein [Candidatus Eremiobacteraeota bacterium]
MKTLLHIFAALVGVVGPFVFFFPFEGTHSWLLSGCKSNCKRLHIALDLYASHNQGLYPSSLETLVRQRYLESLPTCPAARRPTYFYRRFDKLQRIQFACAGNNHARAYTGFSASSNNFPRYDDQKGLVPHP